MREWLVCYSVYCGIVKAPFTFCASLALTFAGVEQHHRKDFRCGLPHSRENQTWNNNKTLPKQVW